jgi:hypothetical protein
MITNSNDINNNNNNLIYNKKRNRDIEFEHFELEEYSKCSKNYNLYDIEYDGDIDEPETIDNNENNNNENNDNNNENNNKIIIEKIKKTIDKNDLSAFTLIVDNYDLSESQTYEVVEMLMSSKFYEALTYMTQISADAQDIILEDFETMIEEYGLDEDSIYFYFECFPKKMFKTMICPDNILFSQHVRQSHSMYLLYKIKNYIENKKQEVHDKELFLNNIRNQLTTKLIQTFNCDLLYDSNLKKDYKIFELIYDIITPEYFNASEFDSHEHIKSMYLKYKQNKSMCEMFSKVKI